jgi:hypothetical protein
MIMAIAVPSVVLAADNAVLLLNRDLEQERVWKMTAEIGRLTLLRQAIDRRIPEMEKQKKKHEEQLKLYNEQLKAMEAAEKEPTEPVKKNED